MHLVLIILIFYAIAYPNLVESVTQETIVELFVLYFTLPFVLYESIHLLVKRTEDLFAVVIGHEINDRILFCISNALIVNFEEYVGQKHVILELIS